MEPRKFFTIRRISFLSGPFATVFLLCLLSTDGSFAQGEANWWYFGDYAGLDFSGGAPIAVTNGQLKTDEGCASISDAAGNLLFYTDGIKVWNKNHIQMPNGFGLMGDPSSTQSGVIIQKPGSATIYYIFTADAAAGANGIRYTEVDMSLNAGIGDVTANKNILLNTPSCEKITGIKHCNKQDVWVVTHDWNSDAFRSYLVTSAGVNTTPVVSNAGFMVAGSVLSTYGQLKASPDGSKLALAIYKDTNRFELCDFNNSTGIVSNAILFPKSSATWGGYGVEFSPDGTKMYGSTLTPGSIYQFNLSAGSSSAIVNSGVVIGSASYCGSLQLGPDKKIYVTRGIGGLGVPWLGVINNPNMLGAGCNYVNNGISLAGKNSYLGLPNFVSYYFTSPPSPFTMLDSCLNGTFTLPSVSSGITSVSWNFGDPASGANNTSAITNPAHTFTNAGTYTVTLVLNYACGNDTMQQTVTVVNCGFTVTTAPTNVLCNGQCTGAGTAAASNGTSPYTYLWNTGGQTTSTATGLCAGIYTVTVTDAAGNTAIATGAVTQPSVLTATISSAPAACGNNGSTTVNAGGGTPGYIYNWSNGQTTSIATGLAAGNYTATITDTNGCTQTQTVTITSTNALTINVSSTQTGCAVNNGAAAATPLSGTAPYAYSWSNGQTTSAATGLGAGTYTITITDSSGCTQTQTATITQIPGPTASASASPNTIAIGASATLSAGGGGTYTWSPSVGLSCVTCSGPVAFPSGTSIYCVTVTDTATGCSDSACVTVMVELDCSNLGELYLPNAFSPNGDGENDRLQIYYGNPKCIKTFELVIYNRWGEKVFETTNATFQWNGAYKGKITNTAAFVYHLRAMLRTGEQIIKKGNVSLVQ